MVPLSVFILSVVLCYVVWRFVRSYFVPSPLDNIPGPPRSSIWTGNMLQLAAHDNKKFLEELEGYGPVAKVHNFFGGTLLHIYDVKTLHSVYVKDQDSYYRGKVSMAAGRVVIGPGLLSTIDQVHKKQRKMLNPVFSGAHMRNLTPVFYTVTGKLCAAIKHRVTDGPKTLDMLGWMGRTALEVVGQGGFGHSFDPLTADSQDEFTSVVKAFIPALSEVPWARVILPYVKYMGPTWFRRLLVQLIPLRIVRRLEGSVEIYEKKKAAIEKGDQELLQTMGEGKDIMSVLRKANLMASEEDKLPDEQLIAQMSTFIIAGVDTTSNALSRVLWLLCEHPDVQEKLRAEIREAREQYGNDIPYDELMQLPYLDAVCRETLRQYAPINMSKRHKGRYGVALSEPIKGVDGTMMNEIAVLKGTTFFLGLGACNTNKALWGEDADEWKPERWLKPLLKTIEEARVPGIYSNLMTFGAGGYSCIGFKFSQLEMKVVLSTLLASFKFEHSEKPVVWNFAGVSYPSTSEDRSTPRMYLKVSVASQ